MPVWGPVDAPYILSYSCVYPNGADYGRRIRADTTGFCNWSDIRKEIQIKAGGDVSSFAHSCSPLFEQQLTLCIFSPPLRNLSLFISCTLPRPKIKRKTGGLVNAYLLLQKLSAMLDDASFDFTLTGSSSRNWKKVEEIENQGNNKSW
jgi:hypothetical protein